MSDKRKPIYVLFAQKIGQKKNKIEIFKASDFCNTEYCCTGHKTQSSYRLRVNGTWYPKGKKEYYWRAEIMSLFYKSAIF